MSTTHPFIEACADGDLSKAQQLGAGLTKDYISKYAPVALLLVCGNGHLAIAQWLHETFELTTDLGEEPSEGEDPKYISIFRIACANGRLRIARWLYTTFGMTATDITADYNSAFINACSNGHLAVAQWLYTMARITQEAANGFALHYSQRYGYIETLQWLCYTFKRPYPDKRLLWDRRMHNQWYWQPHVLALAAGVKICLLVDVLQRM